MKRNICIMFLFSFYLIDALGQVVGSPFAKNKSEWTQFAGFYVGGGMGDGNSTVILDTQDCAGGIVKIVSLAEPPPSNWSQRSSLHH